ncbi:hypothetical protein FJY71_00540 [candidate division WOR-3 bacterium]|nr:hypothetical protein [candidate division WOR-3 bacterium]
MTKLHMNFKDLFRSLRLGFSAKKVWMTCIGLLFGLAGYSVVTYVAHLVAGHELLTVWNAYRLLPFPEPEFLPFPWYAWLVYVAGVAFLLVTMLVTGTAVVKVAYEQLRGDEFYESREAFRFAIKHAASVLASPLLVIGFILLIAVAGVVIGLIGRIVHFGPAFVGLMAFPAFIASLFIVYLGIVLFFTLLVAPAVTGTTRSDTFDTLFESFSCVNEQPWRLVGYTAVVALLAKFGSLLLGLASSLAGRVGWFILRIPMGDRVTDALSNAAFYFKVTLPDWWPAALQRLFRWEVAAYGLPQIYRPGDYIALGWGQDAGAVLAALTFYVVALIVVGYGMSVWFTGSAIAYTVLVHKKDDKNILEIPEDEEELIEPVVSRAEVEPPTETPKT